MSYAPISSAPSDGSRTLTILDSQPRDEATGSSEEDASVGTLRLRGAPRTRDRNRPRVVWREDVVDNEHAGKKSSKICCIYHKPKRFDESSSEESSSDSDSDSDCEHNHPRRHNARENPESRGEGSNTRSRDSAGVVHELHDPANEVNRYERAPRRKGKKPVARNNCKFPAFSLTAARRYAHKHLVA
ncbi:phosphatase inhibitor-domain-containing protein [Cytidiella melzeri]|nr:phosphatase inhibitor-domain-containing protein [Cytidiella melzeri]